MQSEALSGRHILQASLDVQDANKLLSRMSNIIWKQNSHVMKNQEVASERGCAIILDPVVAKKDEAPQLEDQRKIKKH